MLAPGRFFGLIGFMNMPRFLTALTGTLFAVTTAFAQDFEGRLTMEMKEGRNTMTMNYAVKKDFIRVDIPMEGMTMASIVNLPKKEIIMLMPGQNMYMVMPIPDEANADKAASRQPQLEKTNETETILGYLCTKYLTKDGNTTMEIWGAEGIGSFIRMGGNPMQRTALPAWQREMMERGFFPLRMVGRDQRGRETFRMTVVSIDKQSLPDSLFTVPEGFQRFDMGGMLRGGANPFGGK